MDSHNDLLGELAADAALERSDFLFQSTEQLRKFLDHHRDRIAVLGGLTLIDEDPDYLSIAPDLTFRSRSRYLDDVTGEWVSETEVIESAAELVELYNPADIYAAFAEAAREAAGLPDRADRRGRPARGRRDLARGDARVGEDPYAAAADSWAAGQPTTLETDDDEAAARRLYDLALEYQERSQRSEARLLEEFEGAAAGLSRVIGDLIIVDDDDERLTLTATGKFRAEVIPEDSEASGGRSTGADELVEFYDPTDVFGDLADALAEAFPSVAPGAGRATANGTARRPPATGDRRRRRRGPGTPPTRAGTPRTNPPRDHAAGRGRAGRAVGRSCRASGCSRTTPRTSPPVAGRPVRPRPARATSPAWSCAGRSRSTRPIRRPASSRSTSGSSGAARSGSRASGRAIRSTCSGRSGARSRWIRAAGTSCWSPAGSAWPASGCSPTRRSATGAR